MTLRGAPVRNSSAAATTPGVREDDVSMIASDFLADGVLQGWGGELEVTERGAGADMSVDVASGRCYIEVTTTHLTPNVTYRPRLENSATVNLPVPTADGTNPRKDRVIARWILGTNANGAASNVVDLQYLEGTPAGSPSAPAVPTGAISLAIVDVPASDNSITNSQITDDRSFVKLQSDVLKDVARQGLGNMVADASGTDTLTASFDPPITSLVDNMTIIVIPANNNTGAATFSPDGLTAKDIVKLGDTALEADDVKANFPAILTYSLADDNWKLHNSANNQSVTPSLILDTRNGGPASIFPCADVAEMENHGTIAFDDSTAFSPATSSSYTISHTCTGSNRVLFVGLYLFSGGGAPAEGAVTSVTYNGVAMKLIGSVAHALERAFLFVLVNPASGANDINITLSSSIAMEGVASSYTGANQDYVPDAQDTGTQTSGTSVSTTTTTVNDDCWTVMFARNNIANFSSFTGGTNRETGRNNTMADSNGAKTPPGGVTITGTWSGSGQGIAVAASFAPALDGPDIFVLDFDKDTVESAIFQSILPPQYSGGTFTAKFHWISTGTGDVVWGIRAMAIGDNEDLLSGFGTGQTVTDTRQASKLNISAATSAVTIAGTPLAGKTIYFQVFRDADNAADTLDADARLVAVEITI